VAGADRVSAGLAAALIVVTAGFVGQRRAFGAHLPQVPVVAASFDEQGQCKLIQSR